MKDQIETPLGTKKWVIKAIFAWEDEKEEQWLEEMACQGWMLRQYGFLAYQFEKCPPAQVVYRLDYKNNFDKDYAEYQQLFKDAGWKLVLSFAGWHYYCHPAEDAQMPEIFNSNRSKVEKYRRLMWGVLLPILPCIWIMFSSMLDLFDPNTISGHHHFVLFTSIVCLLMLLLLLYTFIRLEFKIRRLQNGIRE